MHLGRDFTFLPIVGPNGGKILMSGLFKSSNFSLKIAS